MVLWDEINGLPLDESSTTAKTSLDEKRQFKERLQTYLWLLAVLIPQDTSYIAQQFLVSLLRVLTLITREKHQYMTVRDTRMHANALKQLMKA